MREKKSPNSSQNDKKYNEMEKLSKFYKDDQIKLLEEMEEKPTFLALWQYCLENMIDTPSESFYFLKEHVAQSFIEFNNQNDGKPFNINRLLEFVVNDLKKKFPIMEKWKSLTIENSDEEMPLFFLLIKTDELEG